MKKFICFVLIAVLSACANLGEPFEKLEKPNSDEAIIYYYRPSQFSGAGVYFDVKENGETVTTLYNGGYDYHKTEAGNKYITAKTESEVNVGFIAEAGKTYFVRGAVHPGFIIGRPALEIVPEDVAVSQLKSCKIIEHD